MANTLPQPISEPIASPRDPDIPAEQLDPNEGRITLPWSWYLTDLGQAVSQAPNRIVSPVSLTAQAASIGATAIAPGQVASGLYSLEYYARITQAATVNSSLTVTLRWTDHAETLSFSGAAMVGNTTKTFQTGRLMVYLDALAPITYETVYVSNGATPMQYQLFVTLSTIGI